MSEVQPQFPQLQSPIVDPKTGLVAIPWYRLFMALWQKAGQAYIPISGAVAFQNTGAGIEAIDATTGTSLGFLLTTGAPGPAIPVVMGVSPQTYIATTPGFLLIFGAQVEISRDGLTYYQASLTGGSFPVLADDRVRMTWFGVDPPEVTFFQSLT